MTSRNRWTAERIRHARQTPLKPLLEKMDYRLQELENGNMEVLGLPKPIIIKEHYWHCPEDGTGGNAIDLLTRIAGMRFSEAMEKIETFG